MTELRLFNSLTRQIEPFVPVHPGTEGDPNDPPEARVYTCGPTVYNYPHIGNMRAYVFADTLGRVLSYKGYKLTHVINITDVGHLTDDADAGEDKMEKMAAEKAQSIWDIARHYTEAYWDDIKALNIRQPAHWSIATDYVPAMIEFAKSIAEKHCYELGGGLYFDTSTVANYGALARARTEDGEGRIDEVEGKRHAADFAIWRKTPAGETRQMEWDSPWGKGAPGWHLECSVMSEALLGLPFDIHTGGIDHREIHHPNEIAQNQARCGGDHSGARVWMHNNFLIERSGKMSKSSGEFLRVQLLIDKGFHPLAYRLMCLQAHYRSELEFSWEGLQAAFVRLKRMLLLVIKADITVRAASIDYGSTEYESLRQMKRDYWDFLQGELQASAFKDTWGETSSDLLASYLAKLDEAFLSDLGTPQALSVIDDALSNVKLEPFNKLRLVAICDLIFGFDLLGLQSKDLRIRPKAAIITEAEIEIALAARKEARAAKDFAKSDAIRDDLIAKGVEVMDGDPLGWDWRLDV